MISKSVEAQDGKYAMTVCKLTSEQYLITYRLSFNG